MTQSPCRHCPKCHQDKNLCIESCDLLNRLQIFHSQHRDYASGSAVNAADEGRYGIMTLFDVNRASASGQPY